MSIRSIRVSHIVLSTEDLAKVLLDHLKEDEYKDREMLFKVFAKMAKKYSACGTRHKGGDLGFLEHNTSAPELEKAAMAAPVGEACGPIKSKFGYHIFVVTDEEEMVDKGIDGLNSSMASGPGTL
ncbi:MAG: peptidylprolyl isomerase [Nitrospinaceae bacterium]|nr:peptidylprolyl isomerase [Nitrospinaceae bacterium]HIK58548.1 peptidylprolyl isomerase [Nitrospinaceae bacterium]